MSEQPTEAEQRAAILAYRDRCKGAILDLGPGVEGLALRGFNLAVCLVPVDGAGPIMPLWFLTTSEPEPTEPSNPVPCEQEPPVEPSAGGSTPEPLEPPSINRGDN